MEIIDAVVVEHEGAYSIKIGDTDAIQIPISEDDPNEVKRSFNRLIARLKSGVFQIKLKDLGQDLFSQVANEYLKQLNKEIIEVHGEMAQYGLVESDGEENP